LTCSFFRKDKTPHAKILSIWKLDPGLVFQKYLSYTNKMKMIDILFRNMGVDEFPYEKPQLMNKLITASKNGLS